MSSLFLFDNIDCSTTTDAKRSTGLKSRRSKIQRPNWFLDIKTDRNGGGGGYKADKLFGH
jgi:hypothetical protein